MSKAEREVKKPTMESCAWIQTADGSVQEVECEVALACPRIRHEMESGARYSKNNPITLPEKIKPTTLSLVIDYCRFHAGRHSLQAHKNFNENFLQRDARILLELLKLSSHLQLGKLSKDTKNALAEKICNKPTEEICRMLNPYLTEDLSKAEKSNLRECPKYETRTRLRKKFYSNRRESLVKNVEQLKDFLAGVNPSQDKDTREVDDLVSFVNGDGDTKGVKTTKEKDKHKKQEQKETSSSSAAASTKASTSKKVIEKNDEDINATDSANSSGSSSNTADLLGTQDESCNVKEDTFYDNLDPVKDAETTRMVEELARLLNLDPTQIYGDPEVDFHVTDYDKE
ncbi:SKP1-like protein 21 isoform X2 [Apium graveolens]|uniref:SKP1-like protein 21 isoform X2 n=1 Tax=Apium graveolens TaxID=4045 RepID=UPI003D796D5B